MLKVHVICIPIDGYVELIYFIAVQGVEVHVDELNLQVRGGLLHYLMMMMMIHDGDSDIDNDVITK